jgi:hypothetical protein
MIEWQTKSSVFRNQKILSQLAVGTAIPMGILTLVLTLINGFGNSAHVLEAIALFAALFIMAYLISLLMYRGTYKVNFRLDNQGMTCQAQPGSINKSGRVNGLTFVAGTLTRKPSILSQGKTEEVQPALTMAWEEVQAVSYQPRQKTIFIKGNAQQPWAIFCNFDNYLQVKEFVQKMTQP